MFEQEAISYLNGLVQNGTLLDGALVGVSEDLNTARAKVTTLVGGEAKDTFIFIKKVNGVFEWMYLQPNDLLDNNLDDNQGWHYKMFPKRLIAPKALLDAYPAIAIQMMIRNLPIVEDRENSTFILYMNYVSPEHQAIVDSNPSIVIEDYVE